MKPKVLIAIPTLGSIRSELATRLEQYRNRPDVWVKLISNVMYHAAARNELAMYHFDPMVYTHLLMIDADTVPPADFVERMLAADRPIVSGVTYGFRPLRPLLGEPVVWPSVWRATRQPDGTETYKHVRLSEVPDEGLLDEQGIVAGCFCMMISGEVFGKLSKPYFKTEHFDPTQEKTRSEDLYFCDQARKAGYRISILCDLVCEHYKTVNIVDIKRYGERMEEWGRLHERASRGDSVAQDTLR